MTTRSLKKRKSVSQVGFVRQTIQSDMLEGIVKIPPSLKHCMVEVILLPIKTDASRRHGYKLGRSPLERFAGAWAGEELVREEQGAYEVREDLK
jgi:hypothetical protein